MPSEAKYALLAFGLTILSYLTHGGRVMTLPFFFVFVLVLLFWSARRSAERIEREEEEQTDGNP
ncbi:MAG TPA: hypothetical protein VGR62_05205 [Candidatus Binatia bacterium]|jgi:hypothetical protein|nr:hypothetical protein [Candidatus Binatia bacterium]